jgi:hypothetical protein
MEVSRWFLGKVLAVLEVVGREEFDEREKREEPQRRGGDWAEGRAQG